MNNTEKSPAQKWKELIEETINKINAIDDETPWKDYEPQWWVEMANVRRELYNLKNK